MGRGGPRCMGVIPWRPGLFEESHGCPCSPSPRFRRRGSAHVGQTIARSRPDPPPFGSGHNLRRPAAVGGGPQWLRNPAERARLGGALQRPGPGRADQRQGPGPTGDPEPDPAGGPEPDPAGGPAGHRRTRTHSGDPRRGALASGGSDPVALGGVPPLDLAADLEPGVAGSGLSQALGPSAPLCPERARGRRF